MVWKNLSTFHAFHHTLLNFFCTLLKLLVKLLFQCCFAILDEKYSLDRFKMMEWIWPKALNMIEKFTLTNINRWTWPKTYIILRQRLTYFCHEITKKALKWTKKVEKRLKKMFRPAFGCAQHPKAGRNTQHIFTRSSSSSLWFYLIFIVSVIFLGFLVNFSGNVRRWDFSGMF